MSRMRPIGILWCPAVALCVSAPVVAAAPADSIAAERQLPPGYRLSVPEAREYRLPGVTVRLHARAFAQGEAVYMELLADTAAAPVASYDGRPVRLSRCAWGLRGFFAIPADSAPGAKVLVVEHLLPDTAAQWRCTLTVAATAFAVSHATMDVGRYSDVDHARDPAAQRFIAACAAKKTKAFARRGVDLITRQLAHPCNEHHVTSPFWSSREYERFEIRDGRRVNLPPSRKVHRGIDLRGARGDPVYAMADGDVALADSLYYEGNFVIIDHGNRVMSYYMHQDSLLVSSGERVRAGQRIGSVGATGVATAAHLHVSVLIDGVQVDPLSILPLPVRE